MVARVIEVVVRGRIDGPLRTALAAFAVDQHDDGTTSIVGTVEDQAALLALLTDVDDLHIEVLSVTRRPAGEVAS